MLVMYYNKRNPSGQEGQIFQTMNDPVDENVRSYFQSDEGREELGPDVSVLEIKGGLDPVLLFSSYYVKDGVLKKRRHFMQEKRYTYPVNSRLVLQDMPLGYSVQINDYEPEVSATSGQLDLDLTEVGSFTLTLRGWPYKDTKVEIEVRE